MDNLFQNPIVLKIHNGTVRGDISLCHSCRNSFITVGARTGREFVRCRYNDLSIVSEPIAKCSDYADKTAPSLHDMKEIAWTLMTDKGGRKIGFERPKNNEERNPIGY